MRTADVDIDAALTESQRHMKLRFKKSSAAERGEHFPGATGHRACTRQLFVGKFLNHDTVRHLENPNHLTLLRNLTIRGRILCLSPRGSDGASHGAHLSSTADPLSILCL